METVAFDWSGKGIDVTFDGVNSERMTDVGALLERLSQPHRIICEATVESYLPEKRVAFIEESSRQGHDLRVYHPKYTARYRKAQGIAKSDFNDSLAIYVIGTSGLVSLQSARVTDPKWAEFSARVNLEHTIGRFSGDTDALVAEFEGIIPKGSLTGTQRLVFLTQAGTWRSQYIAGIVRAARYCDTREKFERLTGMSANGYGSHLRSDVVHWGYVGGISKVRRVDWTTFRRETRRAYHLLRQGIREPVKGNQPA